MSFSRPLAPGDAIRCHGTLSTFRPHLTGASGLVELTDNSKVGLQQLPVCTEPGLSEAVVLGLAGQEVEEVDSETRQHEHLQVETVPIGTQVVGDLTGKELMLFIGAINNFDH